MSAATFIHDHVHVHFAARDHADRRRPPSKGRPDLMVTVIVTTLLVVLAISVIRLFGWYGTAGAFLITLAASGALVRLIRRMVEDSDADGR